MYVVQKVDENEFGIPIYRYRRVDDETLKPLFMKVRVSTSNVNDIRIIRNIESIDISYDKNKNVFTTFKYLSKDSKTYETITIKNILGYEIYGQNSEV